MEAVAHNPDFAKKVGIPQSVGQDFANADDHHANVQSLIHRSEQHGGTHHTGLPTHKP